MGGVWLPPPRSSRDSAPSTPLLGGYTFPKKVQARLVSDKNPDRALTNSDLELAGTIAHEHVLLDWVDCREQTLHTLCDNTPAVAWRTRGLVTTPGDVSYLLREPSLQHRRHRYVSRTSRIPGPSQRGGQRRVPAIRSHG